MAGCCECGDEPLGSCATELVSRGYEAGAVSRKTAVATY
jgi:hypothetical protein